MAESQKRIQNEGYVAPFDGSGAIETAYKKKMMRSVVFIDTNSKPGKGSGCIVALRHSGPMLLTCHHVIPSKDVARKSTIYFDRESSGSTGVRGAELFNLDSEDSFVTKVDYESEKDIGLDFTVIHLNPDKIPGDKREPFYLHKYQETLCGDYSLKKGNNVYLVHYPCIDGTYFRRDNTFVIHFLSGFLMGHKAETQIGSSGCPVLKEYNREWVLAGLHRGQKPKGAPGMDVNLATHVEAIHRTLTDRNYKPEAPADWKDIARESTARSVKGEPGPVDNQTDTPPQQPAPLKYFDPDEFMEKYPGFPEEVAAQAIYTRLYNKKVLGDDEAYDMEHTHEKKAAEILYKYLKRRATPKHIRTLCNVMIEEGKQGYSRMKSLGEKMLKDKDLDLPEKPAGSS